MVIMIYHDKPYSFEGFPPVQIHSANDHGLLVLVKDLVMAVVCSSTLVVSVLPTVAEANRKIASVPRPDSEILKRAQDLAVSGKTDEAVKALTEAVNLETAKDKRALTRMALAVILERAGRDKEAEVQFRGAVDDGTRIDDYANYHLGLIYQKGSRLEEARTAFQRASESASSANQTQIDARIKLAETFIAEKNFKVAANQYQSLLRKTRNTEAYPDVLINLYRADRKLGRHIPACKVARELYAKFPSFPPVRDWGADLARDTLDSEKTMCGSTPADLKTRVRRLQLAGEADRAAKELTGLKDAVEGDDNYSVDSMLANYMISEGRVDEAMKLILKHYKAENARPAYQLLLAKAASRAGEYPAAVGAFMRAYELAPRSKDAANSLFQAAFTSYQFQDYDGATRKFEKFMKAFPKSKLARDSQWHLAWMRYLRGDYAGAHERFIHISSAPMRVIRRHGRRIAIRSDTVAQDRVRYWDGMSIMKMGKVQDAIPIFQKLVRDPALGYYSMLAYYRLSALPGAQVPAGIEVRLGLKKVGEGGAVLTPEEIQAAAEAIKDTQAEYDAQESVASNSAGTDEAADADNADAANGDAASGDAGSTETASDDETDDEGHRRFKDPGLSFRFERARDLMLVGLEEGARRELMEIEKRAHTPADRKLLISEYVTVRNYYRSSYMGEVGFGAQRMRDGLRGDGRTFWEYAYPRAYEPAVLEASKNTSVPEELIWGIMRAESHFRQNAQSPVGALGLMQLMPFTGRKVASLLSMASFEPNSLLTPETNIRLGSRYLQRLLEKFSGSVPLVAAGYNAGPHRVHAWVRNFGQLDMDEFIDHIPFVETRNYVKSVVRNYQIYSLLYSGGTHSLRWLIKPVGVELNDPVPTKEIW
jgi:soluble lytic murein transglycosylase